MKDRPRIKQLQEICKYYKDNEYWLSMSDLGLVGLTKLSVYRAIVKSLEALRDDVNAASADKEVAGTIVAQIRFFDKNLLNPHPIQAIVDLIKKPKPLVYSETKTPVVKPPAPKPPVVKPSPSAAKRPIDAKRLVYRTDCYGGGFGNYKKYIRQDNEISTLEKSLAKRTFKP